MVDRRLGGRAPGQPQTLQYFNIRAVFKANQQNSIPMTTNARMLVKPLAVLTVCTTIFFSCKKNSDSSTTPNSDAFDMSASAAATDNLFNDTYDVLGLTVNSSSSL